MSGRERRGRWLQRRWERDEWNPPAFVHRTCTDCGQRYALDPLEWKSPPAPRETWRCSFCRRKVRTVRNLFGLIDKE